MKKYIILTTDIHPIGGMQTYVASKIMYLKEHGWKVYVFFYGDRSGSCVINSLNEYLKGGVLEFQRQPAEWPIWMVRLTIAHMVKSIDYSSKACDEIIIESQDDVTSLWGELVANRIHAKNFIVCCNEKFVGKNKHYLENIDFFDFKHKRKELVGISRDSLRLLFANYKKLEDEECYHVACDCYSVVNDDDESKTKLIGDSDCCICYFGRVKKAYFECIIRDVAEFAKKYKGRHINFVIIGDESSKIEMLDNVFNKIDNISLVPLGDMFPVPKNVFDKIDVVIAGAGCAKTAVMCGVPTIVADADNYKSNGIFGVDTYNLHFCETGKQETFLESLEKVLIRHVKCDMIDAHIFKTPDENFDDHMRYIADSNKENAYYTGVGHVNKVKLLDLCRFIIRKYFPTLYELHQKNKKRK